MCTSCAAWDGRDCSRSRRGRGGCRPSLEGSLRRLGTDHVDLYWLHVWDDITPAEEVLQGMADLVRVGKVRYHGLCNTPAWFTVQVATLAHAHGLPAPVALQMEYSLVSRDIEREHVRAARELGLGIVPWSPLAVGFLNGKYNRDQSPAADAGRLAQASTPSSSAHARPTSWRRTWPRPTTASPTMPRAGSTRSVHPSSATPTGSSPVR
ncbi:aldo/keto reductase [Lapillicoccus sp.]|uniref:aldo/keto reductase n=1 Tax=Lapillicoccus sp. TaxID=1909287 RepID=UPI003263C052